MVMYVLIRCCILAFIKRSHLVQIHQSDSSPGLEHGFVFLLALLWIWEPHGVALGGSGYSMGLSSVGGLNGCAYVSVCMCVWSHAGPMLLVCMSERSAVHLRAMYRWSPCHKGRIYFDFSEEVVKRLHTSTRRLEYIHSHTFLWVILSICLSLSLTV